MAFKETLAMYAACGALGAGVGYAAEQDTNNVARGRIITIDTCMKTTQHDDAQINKELLDCMQGGVPSGNKIGLGLKEGQPIE